MAFSLHDFIMTGMRDAVGKLSDYQIVLNCLGWLEKGVLTEADLAEIQALIDAKNAPAPEPEPEPELEEAAGA
jgi:hypothetical protein